MLDRVEVIIERQGQPSLIMNKENGYHVLDFIVGHAEPEKTTKKISHTDGVKKTGGTYNSLSIKLVFLLEGRDQYDYDLLEKRQHKVFNMHEPFQIRCTNQPGIYYRAEIAGSFEPTHETDRVGAFELQLVCYDGYGIARGRSTDPFSFSSGLWAFGMGIPMIPVSYRHKTRTFSIWNIGTKKINSKNHDAKIFYYGASKNLMIENETTGDQWQHNGSTAANDSIVLADATARLNGNDIYRNTNHGVITLAPGENKIKLSGTVGSFSTLFDLPFFYG